MPQRKWAAQVVALSPLVPPAWVEVGPPHLWEQGVRLPEAAGPQRSPRVVVVVVVLLPIQLH